MRIRHVTYVVNTGWTLLQQLKFKIIVIWETLQNGKAPNFCFVKDTFLEKQQFMKMKHYKFWNTDAWHVVNIPFPK